MIQEHKNVRDITGMRFGRLIVIKFSHTHKQKSYFFCQCDCLNNIVILGASLINGGTRSCGCYRKEKMTKHGMYKTKTFLTWKGMSARCNSNVPQAYKNYKGKGIKVCDRWLEFKNFYEDMGEKPEGLTIERINSNKNYEKSNCKWGTMGEQARNRDGNRYIEFNGKNQTIMDWANDLGVSWNCIKSRIDIYHWPVEKALTQPKCSRHRPPRIIEYNNRSMCLEEWAREIEISAHTIARRLYKMGWSIEKTLTTPTK